MAHCALLQKCKHKNNRIILSPDPPAGLNDRNWVIRHVVNLANYLCAKVCFPGPSVSLSKNHNSGNRVSDKLSWNDLFLTYDSDFEEVLLDNCDSGEIAKNHETVVIDRINPASFQQALNAFERDETFIWKATRSYYRWDNALQNHFNKQTRTMPDIYNNLTACNFPTQFSQNITNVGNRFLSKHNITNGFMTFHIRRTDAKKECDTDLHKIQNYLSCSLKNCKKPNQATITPIILFSDETSEKYISGVGRILESLGYQMVHGDSEIQVLVKEMVKSEVLPAYFDNNYVIFWVSNYLKGSALHTFQKRRKGGCHDCDTKCQIDIVNE